MKHLTLKRCDHCMFLFNQSKQSALLCCNRIGKSHVSTDNKEPVQTTTFLNNFKDKISDLFSWYEELTGLHEVRYTQNRVIEIQEKFSAAQDSRRELNVELVNLRNKIKDVQAELLTVSKAEEKFMTLMTHEHKLLKEELRLSNIYKIYEKEERDCFNALTAAVKENHEKERISANTTKYVSIIGSIIGTVIGVVGSSVNNHFKHKNMKNTILELLEKQQNNGNDLTDLVPLIDKIEHKIETNAEKIRTIISTNNNSEKNAAIDLAPLIKKIEINTNEISTSIKLIKNLNEKVNKIIANQYADKKLNTQSEVLHESWKSSSHSADERPDELTSDANKLTSYSVTYMKYIGYSMFGIYLVSKLLFS